MGGAELGKCGAKQSETSRVERHKGPLERANDSTRARIVAGRLKRNSQMKTGEKRVSRLLAVLLGMGRRCGPFFIVRMSWAVYTSKSMVSANREGGNRGETNAREVLPATDPRDEDEGSNGDERRKV